MPTPYERAIQNLLTALLYPALVSPQRQVRLHGGRKRVDLALRMQPRPGSSAGYQCTTLLRTSLLSARTTRATQQSRA